MKLLEGLSPRTKSAMTKRMAEVRMAEMQQQLEGFKKPHDKPNDIDITEQEQASQLTANTTTAGANEVNVECLMTSESDPMLSMLSEMSQNQPRNPDGCTMLMSTQEHERRVGYIPNTSDSM